MFLGFSLITFQNHPTDGEEILDTIQPAVVGSWISIQVDRHAVVEPEPTIVMIGNNWLDENHGRCPW